MPADAPDRPAQALRPPVLDPGALSAAQRAAYEAILAGPRGTVEGPLRIWVLNPGLADTAQRLGAYCRYGTSLPPRLSELAILVTGAAWRAGFEWAVHAPIARRAGLSEGVVEALRRGLCPEGLAEDEAAVHDFAVELHRDRRVAAPTYARALAALGQAGVIDLVGILGYYTLISMTINAFEVPPPDGAADPFAS